MRDDSRIDFDWSSVAPSSGLPVNNFSVRWQVHSFLKDGTYQFYALSDDGIRVWADDVLVIDQ